VPHKRFSVLANWCSFLSSSGTPKTAVIVFPFRPLTSLLILTIPWFEYIYFALKNLVLPRKAGFSMGHACPALRESEFSGSA